MKRTLLLVMAIALGLGALPALQSAASRAGDAVVDTGATYVLSSAGVRMTIHKDGFRYGFDRADGTAVVAPHPVSGLLLRRSGEPSYGTPVRTALRNQPAQGRIAVFEVAFSNGLSADVIVSLTGGRARVKVAPLAGGDYDIQVRVAGGLQPAYGLGDHGGYGAALDVYGTDLGQLFQHQYDAGTRRYVSTFTIHPAQGFAQVLLATGIKQVRIDGAATLLGATAVPALPDVFYFVGDPRSIYADYRAVRTELGSVDKRPDEDFFGVGFESYGALAWNTNQATVTDMVQQYLDRGYPLQWAVVGSGFWPNAGGANEGATTSFGMWGQKYPDPDALKGFLKQRDIKLIMGLRHGFKALPADGGSYDPALDGPYTVEGVEHGYFVKGPDGKPKVFDVHFPKTPVYLLDAENPAAVAWYAAHVDKWGADGFKEDFMFLATANGGFYDDDKINPILERLADKGYLMMVRNAAYSVAGSILRINDTDYNHGPADTDRTAINSLAYAAGGQPNFYPDIIGGRPISSWDDGKRRYLTRNAMLGAVSPSMSFGNAPWAMQRADYEAAVLKAAQWHEKYVPYIHSAALDAHETGYPSTATPLPIAYPDDPATYELGNRSNKQYEWMLGPSLLVHPLFGSDYVTATTRDVYLPEGKWVDLEDGTVHHGPTTLTGQPVGIDEVPAFVGGKGVLVSGDTSGLRAEVFPIATGGSTFTHRTATLTSTIRNDNTGWDLSALQVLDTTTDRPVAFDTDPVTGAIDFALQPGHDYRLVGGGNAPHPFEVETEAPGVPQGLAVTTVDRLATLSWQPVDGARSYTVLRVADDGSTSVAGSTSTTSLALGFATETEGWFAVRASSSAGTSGTSERIAVGDPAPVRVDQAFTDDFAAPTGAWQPVSGTWQVRDGRFEVSGTVSTLKSLTSLRKHRWTADVSAAADIRIGTRRDANSWAGVQVAQQAPTDGYVTSGYTAFVRANGTVVLIKPEPATPGAVVTLGSAASGLDPVAAPVRLRVEVVGDRVRVFAGDGPDPLVDVQDTTYRDGGVALLSTYSEASFDGVAVRLP